MIKGTNTISLLLVLFIILFHSIPYSHSVENNKLFFNKTPLSSCSNIWEVIDANGECVPKYYLSVCGETWRCNNDIIGDSFRLTEKPLECKDGKIVIIELPTIHTPADDTFGLLIVKVYACAPITSFPTD